MPRPASRIVGLVAAASLYVYLTHWQIWPALPDALPVAPALALTVAGGVAAWAAAERLSGLARRAWATWAERDGRRAVSPELEGRVARPTRPGPTRSRACA
jgi:hypothetical protein